MEKDEEAEWREDEGMGNWTWSNLWRPPAVLISTQNLFVFLNFFFPFSFLPISRM